MFEVLTEWQLSIPSKNIVYCVTTANNMSRSNLFLSKDNDQQFLLLNKWDKHQSNQCSSSMKTRKPESLISHQRTLNCK